MENKNVIVFIGDSITDVSFNRRTWHLKAKTAYPLQVKAQLTGYKYIFKGIASNRSYHVYDRLTNDCIKYNPNIVVLLIGVNDAWQQYVPEQYPPLLRDFEPHFSEILRRFKAELANAKVIVMTPFIVSTIAEKMPFKPFLIPYVDFIKTKSLACGYEVIDLQAVFDAAEKEHAPVELSTDGIHPTTLGHSYIAAKVLETIAKITK